MGETQKRRGGKKNRKYGRSARKPSHFRYNLEERWKKNKARKAAKQAKKEAKKRAKKAHKSSCSGTA